MCGLCCGMLLFVLVLRIAFGLNVRVLCCYLILELVLMLVLCCGVLCCGVFGLVVVCCLCVCVGIGVFVVCLRVCSVLFCACAYVFVL